MVVVVSHSVVHSFLHDCVYLHAYGGGEGARSEDEFLHGVPVLGELGVEG